MSEIYEHYTSGPITIAERGSGGASELIYFVSGAATRSAASALARATAPLVITAGEEQLVRQTVRTEPEGIDCWLVTINYGPENDSKSNERPVPGTWKFDFDTTGGRHKVTRSKATISRHKRAGDDAAPDLLQAVNYDGKKVNGTEVYVPNGRFSITAYYEPIVVTTELMREFMRKTPRVNSDEWLGFAAGEVLYLGSQGQGDIPTVAGQRVQPIAIKHFFDASENRTNVDDAGVFDSAINVKGWEYLWYVFKEYTSSSIAFMAPRWAYVERMYDDLAFGDFFGFGAGG